MEVFRIGKEIQPLIEETGKMKNVSDEYKRHRVYAMAIKKFPDTRPKVISLAIELVINKAI